MALLLFVQREAKLQGILVHTNSTFLYIELVVILGLGHLLVYICDVLWRHCLIIINQIQIGLIIWQTPDHIDVIRILLVQALVVSQCHFEVLVELLVDDLVKDGHALSLLA